MIGGRSALFALALSAALVPADLPSAAERDAARTLCTGRYADTLAAMTAVARARESRAAADYVYCLRATAVYEQVSWARGGKLRRQYHTKVRHGTGFAYRQRGGEWLLATNQHVVSFPEVTGDGADLEGIPPGARKVREEVKIVASEADPDGPDAAQLSEVVADEALDVAVLASRRPLRVLPYRIGRSADLRVGNAVLVRGFPLGAFAAANGGRVIALGQRDRERGWDHEDFAVDALLNLGSSGSPVLAVSCETGEPELVGIYHAGYRGAQGLNVVVAIDGLRRVLEDLVAPARPAASRVAGAEPREAKAALASGPVVMPFGGRTVRVEREGDAVRFGVLDPSFPLSNRVEVSIVDRGAPASGRAAELREALWEQLGLVLRFRAAEGGRDAPSLRERISARVREREQDQAELVAAMRAGADGLAPVIASDRDREPRDGARQSPVGPVLILGAR
ncbi:MAG TPA: serine protease [Anaeromyxobacter sp.]|nr:serine protease [Anaeromyxobacter sp.]